MTNLTVLADLDDCRRCYTGGGSKAGTGVPGSKTGSIYWWRAQGDDGANVGSWTATRAYVPNQVPIVPVALIPNTGLVTSLTPTLSSIYDDLDAGDSGFVHFEVFDASTNTLVVSGNGTTARPGERSTWSLPSGLVDGGSYYWRAWADDGWQASAATANRSVLVAVGGDIYHAKVYTGDPTSGGELIAEEWARINTLTARYQDSEMIKTRQPVPCPTSYVSGQQCEEVRTATLGSPRGLEGFAVYTSRTEAPNLDQVASLLEAANALMPGPVGGGQNATVLESWQTQPPASSGSYDLYQVADAETGETTQVWIDQRTRMPLKEITTDSVGQVIHATFWTYDATRSTIAQHAADFFGISKPTNTSMEKYVEVHGNEVIGPVGDIETSGSFMPYDVGPTARIRDAAGTFTDVCLTAIDVVRQTWSAAETETLNEPEPDPELTPDPRGPETYILANYVAVPSGGRCLPGMPSADEIALTVVSMADTSSMAAAARGAIVDPAQSIESNPLDPDYARAGVRSTYVQSRPATGYVIAGDEETTSTLIDVPDEATTLVMTGAFDKTTLDDVTVELEPR